MDQTNGELIMTPAESEAAIRRLLEMPRLSAALPIEPGHVMSREAYQRLVEEQQR